MRPLHVLTLVGLGRGTAAEVVAVVAWGGVKAPAERSVHGLGGAEAAGLGDLFDGSVGGLEETAGGLEPDGFDVVGCGGADLGLEDAGELSFGEIDVPGSAATDRSSVRWSRNQGRRSRTGSVTAACPARSAENCAWPPERCR